MIKSGLCNHPGKVKKECEDPQELGRAWVNPFSVDGSGWRTFSCLCPPSALAGCSGAGLGASPSCRSPSFCPQGKPWGRREKRSQALISYGGRKGERSDSQTQPPSGASKGKAAQRPRNAAARGRRGRNHGNPALSACQETLLNL